MIALIARLVGPVLAPFVLYAAIAGAAGIGWLTLKTHYYNQGWAAALHAVAAKDAKAVEEAGNAQRNVTICTDSGGTWNVVSGMCDH